MAVHFGILIVLTLASCDLTQAACGPMALEGFIESTNYPGNYPLNHECIYRITQPEGQVVTMDFTNFEVEYRLTNMASGLGCPYDYLKVYDSATVDEAHLLGTFCGDSLPAPLASTGNTVLLHFVSDDSFTYSGFKIQLDNSGCEDAPGGCAMMVEKECHDTCTWVYCTSRDCVKPDQYDCLPGFAENFCKTLPVCFGEPAGTCPNEGTCLEPDHCECPPGFSEPRCDDIDECLGQHCCSHVCVNDIGSYHCECPPPLILKSDLRTCKNPNAPSHALPDTDDRGKACPGFAGHKPTQTPAQPSQSQRNRNFKSD